MNAITFFLVYCRRVYLQPPRPSLFESALLRKTFSLLSTVLSRVLITINNNMNPLPGRKLEPIKVYFEKKVKNAVEKVHGILIKYPPFDSTPTRNSFIIEVSDGKKTVQKTASEFTDGSKEWATTILLEEDCTIHGKQFTAGVHLYKIWTSQNTNPQQQQKKRNKAAEPESNSESDSDSDGVDDGDDDDGDDDGDNEENASKKPAKSAKKSKTTNKTNKGDKHSSKRKRDDDDDDDGKKKKSKKNKPEKKKSKIEVDDVAKIAKIVKDYKKMNAKLAGHFKEIAHLFNDMSKVLQNEGAS